VVAEGVENEAQRDFLLERQCRIMQGFLFARPMPADEICALLEGEARRQAEVAGSYPAAIPLNPASAP